MTIILLGSNNPSGASFLANYKHSPVEVWGRKKPDGLTSSYIYCDLLDPASIKHQSLSGVIVSFAPIWLLASFLATLAKEMPETLHKLTGIIACSSSSFATKRFAYNTEDKQLVSKLLTAHSSLQDLAKELSIPCQILAPTLVYGRVGNYTDKNISTIIRILRRTPCIVLPQQTGFRQPIHATQLALAAMRQTEQIGRAHV